MEKGYKILGNYIRLVDERNKNLAVTKLLGVSISKKFIPSIANIVGTDLSNYKIVRTGQFAYGPVTSRNGEKISIAYLDEEDCIISSSYTVFEVENKEELDPEYLMLWFSRPEFDRYARYKSHGSVREIFDWNELCMVELPVPDIEKQRKIVKAYKTITDRIDLKQKINDNLEQQAQALFQELFITNADPNWRTGTIINLGTVIGGSTPSKAKPEYYTKNGIAWITPKDLSINKSKFITHGENDITELGLKNSSATVMPEGTVLFSSRAPIGYIAIAAGNITTNQGFKSVVPNDEIGTAYVYYYLKQNLSMIERLASGSTFKEVSGGTMKSVPAIVPDSKTIEKFNSFCLPIFEQQKVLETQNQTLAGLRDSLLPKLMSGELDASAIQL